MKFFSITIYHIHFSLAFPIGSSFRDVYERFELGLLKSGDKRRTMLYQINFMMLHNMFA